MHILAGLTLGMKAIFSASESLPHVNVENYYNYMRIIFSSLSCQTSLCQATFPVFHVKPVFVKPLFQSFTSNQSSSNHFFSLSRQTSLRQTTIPVFYAPFWGQFHAIFCSHVYTHAWITTWFACMIAMKLKKYYLEVSKIAEASTTIVLDAAIMLLSAFSFPSHASIAEGMAYHTWLIHVVDE